MIKTIRKDGERYLSNSLVRMTCDGCEHELIDRVSEDLCRSHAYVLGWRQINGCDICPVCDSPIEENTVQFPAGHITVESGRKYPITLDIESEASDE